MLKSTMKASNKSSHNWQKGGVAIIVALSLPVLIGMAGLALDLGKLYVTKTELQNAADACALAAAVELDGTASQFTIAESRGIAVGKLNKSYFQSKEDDLKPAVLRTVGFATSLNGAYEEKSKLTSTPANYKFVQCTASREDIPNYLIPVLGILGLTVDSSSEVAAAAVASNRPGQSTCALPIGICSSAVSNTTPVGTWIEGTLSAGNGVSGSYKWIDFSAPNGGQREIREILNGTNSQDCNLNPISEDVEQMGAMPNLEDHYNTRFGIKQDSAKNVESIPDFSGFSYHLKNWPSKFGAYSDFSAKRLNNVPFQGVNDSGIALKKGFEPLTKLQHSEQGRDRRVTVAPVINCDLFGPGNPVVPVQRYVCVFLLHPVAEKKNNKDPEPTMYLEYLGNAQNAGPCNQIGLAGASDGVGPRVSALVQ